MATHLPVEKFTEYFMCPCTHEPLELEGEALKCPACNRTFPIHNNVIEFIDPTQLDDQKAQEHAGNTIELTEETIRSYAREEHWNPDLSYRHGSTRKMQHLVRMMAKVRSDKIASLGSGIGFELRRLLQKRKFRTVFSSDIALSRVSVVPYTLENFDVELSVSTSDLDESPIRRRDIPILIYEALHHTGDMHATLERLLQRGYHNVFFVEPTNNFVIDFLSRKGMAARVEYSGLKPGRLEMKLLHKICRDYGYEAKIVTMWDFPGDYLRKIWKREDGVQKTFLVFMDLLSMATNPFNFGNISIVHLRKKK